MGMTARLRAQPPRHARRSHRDRPRHLRRSLEQARHRFQMASESQLVPHSENCLSAPYARLRAGRGRPTGHRPPGRRVGGTDASARRIPLRPWRGSTGRDQGPKGNGSREAPTTQPRTRFATQALFKTQSDRSNPIRYGGLVEQADPAVQLERDTPCGHLGTATRPASKLPFPRVGPHSVGASRDPDRWCGGCCRPWRDRG
jgi:hypothetical protein